MKENSSQAQAEPKKKSVKKIILKVVAVAAAIALTAFGIHYMSPEQQVRRSFSKAVKSLEKMSPRETADCFSNNFTNPIMPDKAAIENMLGMVFNQFKSVKVHIVEMQVEVIDKTTAKATVEGSIYFKDKEEKLYRAKSETPAVFTYAREGKAWKIIAVDGADLNLLEAAKEELF